MRAVVQPSLSYVSLWNSYIMTKTVVAVLLGARRDILGDIVIS
jgi:hypothetical protein